MRQKKINYFFVFKNTTVHHAAHDMLDNKGFFLDQAVNNPGILFTAEYLAIPGTNRKSYFRPEKA